MARARGAGLALKAIQWFVRAVEFLCSAVILAIFSYFLAALKNHDLSINNQNRAVEGISGIAVLYTLVGLLFLCFVAGHTFFSLTAIVLDIAFLIAFIYVAIENKNGARSCSGVVDTVFGSGDSNTDNTITAPSGGVTLLPSFKQACQLQTACFAVAIVAIVFFLISAVVEVALMRHHKKEKAFGPSPANNYTSGSTSRRRFWQRGSRNKALAAGGLAAHEKRHPDSLPVHTTPDDIRNSYATENTAVDTEPLAYNKYGNNGVGGAHTHESTGYYAAPVSHNNAFRDGITGETPANQYPQSSAHNGGTF